MINNQILKKVNIFELLIKKKLKALQNYFLFQLKKLEKN